MLYYYHFSFQIWALADLLLILLSIFITTAESVDLFRVPSGYNVSTNETDNIKEILFWSTDLHPTLVILEWFSNAIFTLELLLRMYACPSRWLFFTSTLNWVDIVCIVSVYITLLMPYSPWESFRVMVVYRMFLGLRSLRVIRLFR